MNRKISKEELKSKDAFLSFSERASAYLADWIKPILMVVGSLLVASLAYIGYGHFQTQAEVRAADEIYTLQQPINEKRRQLEEAASAQESEEIPDWKSLTDFSEDFSPLTSALKEALRRHSDRQAAIMASMSLASLFAEFELWAEAKEVLSLHDKTLTRPRSLLSPLLTSQLAAVQAHLQESQEALNLYQQVLDNRAAQFLHPEVMLKIGFLHEQAGQPEAAQNMLRRLAAEYGDTEAGRSARGYLRLMQLESPPNPSQGSEG